MSDIAIMVNTPLGIKCISYLDVMTDNLFQSYINRGFNLRDDAIITKEQRDLDPLTCNPDGTFVTEGNIDNWFNLN